MSKALLPKERQFILVVLLLVATMVGIDLATDSREGVTLWHVLGEGSIGAVALAGVFYILRESLKLRRALEVERREFSQFRKEAHQIQAELEAWKADSKKYIDGLATAIDAQMTKWHLSPAEKEVALLLLKGLSLKEIADVRSTSEKTARLQSTAIYSKAGLNGRSELAAFFLEDLLLPKT